ncbi:CHAT domain-containing protein [Oscillatoria sp. FACHB-1406]|uniref:CHAT domain-containing protein n=1 Tax=Oscillatoria sp. FACHB-1406 TaxID=2692846 RepID=UPI0016876751|nr:CHAT domain-containing protein [Oscillatoria sp. FACHB-1406]MBD2577855.1 CHAT domain-containing protein [Oscillatoria sp. FACHB-1406]
MSGQQRYGKGGLNIRGWKRWVVLAFLTFVLAIAPPAKLSAQPDVTPYQQAAALELQALQQRDKGDLAAAAAGFRQVRERYQALGETERAADAFLELAKTVLLMKDYPTAIAMFEQIVAEGGNNAQNLTNLGLAYFETAEQGKAEVVLQRAIAYWENLRALPDTDDIGKVTLLEQQAHTYRLLQKVLVAQNKTDAALEIAEASRARSLVEQLARASGATAPQIPTLADIQRIAQQQDSTLVEYSIVGSEARVVGIEPRDETYLYIWVVRPSGRVAFRQVDLREKGVESVRALVEQTRSKSLGWAGRGRRGNDVNSPTPLQQLHQLLIAPIADLLPADPEAQITFIPQDALFLVPFAALQARSGEYFVQQHTLLAAPSIQLLSLMGKNTAVRGNKLAIVGNPTMPSIPILDKLQPLPPLPGSEEEARAIAALYDTSVLTGDAATKANVIAAMRDADIIHFATHGLLDFDADLNAFGEVIEPNAPTAREGGVFVTPGGVLIGDNVFINGVPANIALAREKVVRVAMPGMLALAPTEGDNGFLSAKDIISLPLKAHLVVLSACDTGRGRITGEGVVGLTRAFMAAGAESVVVSLWAVPDAPTAELMVAFYRNFKEKGNAARSLRQAMLATMQKHPKPIDWAAFVLVGVP